MTERHYSATISEDVDDPAWDAFLENTDGGDHLQTSLWAQVKASVGWRPIRLVVRCQGLIAGGAQILVRQTPLVGAIGCVAKGPVLTHDDPALAARIIAELQQIAKSYSLQKLCVQPPRFYESFPGITEEMGFCPSKLRLSPPATTLIDLSGSLDDILARMKPRTRHNIRRSERKEIAVRPGTWDDLEKYYELVLATTSRKQFASFPVRYYKDIWRVLKPRGKLHLLVAEYERETVSSLMLIAFGDTVLNKLGVWSGGYGDKRPNEALHWAAIKLAKSLGFRYYDLGGIGLSAAKAMLQDEPLPDSAQQTVSSFKLDFGGDVVLFPGAWEFHPNPFYRWAFREIYPKFHKYRPIKKAIDWLRTR